MEEERDRGDREAVRVHRSRDPRPRKGLGPLRKGLGGAPTTSLFAKEEREAPRPTVEVIGSEGEKE